MSYDTIPPHLLRQRVYLLHFYNPETLETARLAHAGHYCGMSEDVSARLAEHGTAHGAKLTRAVHRAGLSWVVARTWRGGRRLEKQLKSQKNAPRQLCPICRGEVDLAAVIESQGRTRAGGRVIGKRVPMTERPVQFQRGPTPTPTDCAWCLRDRGIAPDPARSHGICQVHAQEEFARYRGARVQRLYQARILAGKTMSGMEPAPAPSLSTT
jgi:predicted GIY-YIG superfamily endonuclease